MDKPNLKRASEYEGDTRLTMILRGILAYDRETGAFLTKSNGHSRYAPKWFLFFGDAYKHPVVSVQPDIRPYREWRTSFRAWDENEAIEIANKKLEKLAQNGNAHVSAILSVFYQ